MVTWLWGLRTTRPTDLYLKKIRVSVVSPENTLYSGLTTSTQSTPTDRKREFRRAECWISVLTLKLEYLVLAFWRSGSAREGRALDTAPDRRARRHTLTSDVGTRPARYPRRCGCRSQRARRRQGGRASP